MNRTGLSMDSCTKYSSRQDVTVPAMHSANRAENVLFRAVQKTKRERDEWLRTALAANPSAKVVGNSPEHFAKNALDLERSSAQYLFFLELGRPLPKRGRGHHLGKGSLLPSQKKVRDPPPLSFRAESIAPLSAFQVLRGACSTKIEAGLEVAHVADIAEAVSLLHRTSAELKTSSKSRNAY